MSLKTNIRPSYVARLLACSSGAALLLGLSVAAQAQSEAMETIVVSGIRESMQSAMQIKQKSTEVVDSVVAEDIGKLSDQNLSDTITRIPGIQGYRYGGEGNGPAGQGAGVTIRGLTGQTSAQLNGRIFNSPGLREYDTSNAIPGLVAGIDVYKNQTAEHIEGAIGGTLNLRTRRPMDFNGTAFSAGFTARYNDLIKQPEPDYFGLASTRWNTSIGEMGFLVAAEYSQTKNRSDNTPGGAGANLVLPIRADDPAYASSGGLAAYTGRTDTWYLKSIGSQAAWSALTSAQQANVISAAAANTNINNEDIERTRLGAAVSFQWRPSNKLEFVTDVIYNYYLYDQHFHFLSFADTGTVQNLTTAPYNFTEGLWNRNSNGGTDSVVATQRLTSATFMNSKANATGGISQAPARALSISQNAKWMPTDDFELSADVSFVRSDNRGAYGGQANTTTGLNQSYNIYRDLTTVPHVNTITAAGSSYDFNDPRAWVFKNWAAGYAGIKDTSYAISLDAKYTVHGLPLLTQIKSGFRYYHLEETYRDWNFSGKNLTTNGAALAADYSNAVSVANSAFEGLIEYAPTNIFGGDIGYAGGFPTIASTVNLTNQLAYAFPNSGIALRDAQPEVIANRRDAYENTFGGYVQGEFSAWDDFITGNVGVRVVGTADRVVGMTANSGTDASQGYSRTTGKSWYVDVMPSANASLHWTDEFVTRLAWSKGVTRPTFGQLNPAQVFASTGEDSVSTGNANLKATTAYSYDLAFEYYFDTGAYVSVDFWDKEIDGFITTVLTPCTSIPGHVPTYHGQGCTGDQYVISTTQNGGSGYARGIELSGQTFFTFLPGIWKNFGTSVSYAFIDTQNPTQFKTGGAYVNVPMGLQSKNAAAASLLYEDDKISGRLVYTYRSSFILFGAAANPSDGRVVAGYGLLDAALNYDIGWGVTLSGTVSNITNAAPNRYIGEPGKYFSPFLRQGYDNGRVYSLGIRFKTGE
ncbi:TonB-dependent receptor [Rhizomicrobium electricum]|uniref:TonB-dependent receptor n=1 Tax=Rhizomicrobium electricum TaxID=480070 RepID=A0ABP3PV38_9PROT